MQQIRILFATLVLLGLIGCARSDFSKLATPEVIKQALTRQGLQVCAEYNVNWDVVPGFVSGKVYEVEQNCAAFDANQPGARVFVVQFSDAGARDAALRNFETVYRRHMGAGISYSHGPLAILVDGNYKSEVIAIVQDAITSTGAP